jgi:3-isopropylmalate/(R)-2-methylmalate dehydratase large subunit
MIMYIISQISTGGGTGYFVEYAGQAITDLSMEARMTICNMSIEMGARGGLIAPDEKTLSYLKNLKSFPESFEWSSLLEKWKDFKSDPDAVFDREIEFNADHIQPMITYGTNPGMGIAITDSIPSGNDLNPESSASFLKSLDYMGFAPGMKVLGQTG